MSAYRSITLSTSGTLNVPWSSGETTTTTPDATVAWTTCRPLTSEPEDTSRHPKTGSKTCRTTEPALGRGPTAFGLTLTLDQKTGFLAVGDSGIEVLDLTDISTPRLIGHYSVSSPCMMNGQTVFSGNCSAAYPTLSRTGALLYVPSAWGGLKIVNVGALSRASTQPCRFIQLRSMWRDFHASRRTPRTEYAQNNERTAHLN